MIVSLWEKPYLRNVKKSLKIEFDSDLLAIS